MNQSTIFDVITKYQPHSETSKRSAREIESAAETWRGAVLRLLQSRPDGCTDDEMQVILGMNPSTQRPRRIELVERNFVEDSGLRRPTRSGKPAVVWKICGGCGASQD